VLRVGLVGYGYWGPNYARLLRETERACLTWCCDLSADALSAAKEGDPALKTTQRLDELLAAADCDAVIVVVPTVRHYDVASRVIASGKHLLVEKPLAATSEQARALVAFPKSAGVVRMVGHVYLYNPAVRHMREAIVREEVGSLRYLSASRIGFSPKRDDVDALWDLSPHDISMILHLVGEMPLCVSAFSHAYLRAGRADVVLSTMQFSDGTVADMQASWDTPFKQRRLTVVGAKQTLVFDDVAQEKLRIYDGAKAGHDGRTVPLPPAEPLKQQLEHFLDCIERRVEPATTFEDGLDVVRVLGALSLSAQRRATVALA